MYELFVVSIIIECGLGVLTKRLYGRQMVKVQTLFSLADLSIFVLEDSNVEIALASEIVINHPFVDMRKRSNVVDEGV
jgi:hypothetical protein